jgi:starch phosphorylase
MQIKRNNKARFIDFIKSENKLKDERGVIFETAPMIDIDSLFDVQAKRIHEYKRQLMNALHIIMLYFDILDNPHHERVKRTFIFGGKAAAGYETAKDIIRLINAIARKVNKDPHTRGTIKVVYVENYNVSRAEYIIPAADLSEQISTAGTEASGTGNMKFAINGALTIGTEDGANIEMREAVGDRWWPFRFGALTETIEGMKKINSYNPHAIYEQNLQIKRAVDALRDRTFAQNDHEHHAFSDLFHKLIEGHYGGPPDRYFTLLDLENYYETQKLVDALYLDQEKWARLVIHNIAGMGPFTTDRSIRDYAEKIWGLKPCPIDPEIEDRIRYEYSLVDQCRIY